MGDLLSLIQPPSWEVLRPHFIYPCRPHCTQESKFTTPVQQWGLLTSPSHSLCCDRRWSHQLWRWAGCPTSPCLRGVTCDASVQLLHPEASVQNSALRVTLSECTCRHLRPSQDSEIKLLTVATLPTLPLLF